MTICYVKRVVTERKLTRELTIFWLDKKAPGYPLNPILKPEYIHQPPRQSNIVLDLNLEPLEVYPNQCDTSPERADINHTESIHPQNQISLLAMSEYQNTRKALDDHG